MDEMPLRIPTKSLIAACMLVLLVVTSACPGQALAQPKPPRLALGSVHQPAERLPLTTTRTEQQAVRLPPIDAPRDNTLPIDLPTALQLADANNPFVRLAREQSQQAWDVEEAASALWLPSIRLGANYNNHQGAIQQVDGTVFNTSRGALYAGSGAGVVGAGPPMVPGIVSQFHLADALFRPLAARQFARSRNAAARAVTNDMLLDVSLAYLELLRAAQDIAIAEDALGHAIRLADITASYARTGQGLRADADRAAVERSIRRNEVSRAREAAAVASARLVQLLRLEPGLCLVPIEGSVVPLELVPCSLEPCDLVAEALTARPELVEARLLVSEAVQRMRRERAAPLVPSVLLGVSDGVFGGGIGSDITNTDNRFNADAMLYWEIRNFGVGDRALRNAAQSQVRQATLRQVAVLDQVAREVVEAEARVRLRRDQVQVSREATAWATESYRLNLQRIEHAQGLPLEVLQSIQALVQAQRELLRSVTDYNAAQFSLQRALGWRVTSGPTS